MRRRSSRAGCLALLGATVLGLLSLDAGAAVQPPPLPPLPPPPPVQVPTLPELPRVPPPPAAPTLPTLPRPPAVLRPPALPPSTPAPPADAPQEPAAGGPASSSGSSTGVYSGGTAGGTGQARTSGAATRRPSRIARLSSSRTWISRSGPEGRRKTILRFVLSRPGLVEFVVVRVAPDCRQVGRFRVKGRAGVNRVPFRGRVNGRALAPGTYRIRARGARGRTLAETRIVIFKGTPLPEEVAAARASDTCGRQEGTRESASSSDLAAVGGPAPRDVGVLRVQEAGGTSAGSVVRLGKRDAPVGVLGARFTRAADAVKEIHLILFVILGIAIGLLAIAALPMRYVPHERMASVLAYRRSAVALTGATALVAVTVLYALA